MLDSLCSRPAASLDNDSNSAYYIPACDLIRTVSSDCHLGCVLVIDARRRCLTGCEASHDQRHACAYTASPVTSNGGGIVGERHGEQRQWSLTDRLMRHPRSDAGSRCCYDWNRQQVSEPAIDRRAESAWARSICQSPAGPARSTKPLSAVCLHGRGQLLQIVLPYVPCDAAFPADDVYLPSELLSVSQESLVRELDLQHESR